MSMLVPLPVSHDCGPPTDWEELAQAHDDGNVAKPLLAERPVIESHSQ